jgi:hypothetical protein
MFRSSSRKSWDLWDPTMGERAKRPVRRTEDLPMEFSRLGSDWLSGDAGAAQIVSTVQPIVRFELAVWRLTHSQLWALDVVRRIVHR